MKGVQKLSHIKTWPFVIDQKLGESFRYRGQMIEH